MFKILLLILVFIIFFLFYFYIHIFLENTLLKSYNFYIKNKKSQYLYTSILIVIPIIFLLICFFTNENLYTLFYTIYLTYIGILMYSLIFTFILKIIELKFHFSKFFYKLSIFILPLLISIYGLLNSQINNIENITLEYPYLSSNLKIAHLTDIHLGVIYKKGAINKITDILIENNPDIIVITGDLSDGSLTIQPSWFDSFEKLYYRNISILYITGNHEEIYNKNKILNVIKEVPYITYIGSELKLIKNNFQFIGIDYEDFDVIKKAKELLKNVKKKYFNILLYHIPKIKPKDLNEIGIDLMLSGHTHGGQLFPHQIFVYLLMKCFNGLYKYNDSNYIYVSSGVNTALIPMRILSKSKIVFITVKGK